MLLRSKATQTTAARLRPRPPPCLVPKPPCCLPIIFDAYAVPLNSPGTEQLIEYLGLGDVVRYERKSVHLGSCATPATHSSHALPLIPFQCPSQRSTLHYTALRLPLGLRAFLHTNNVRYCGVTFLSGRWTGFITV